MRNVSQGARIDNTHAKQLRKLRILTMPTVKNSQQGAEVKILVGAGPRGGTFARAVPCKGATFEDLELFFKVLQTRYGHSSVL